MSLRRVANALVVPLAAFAVFLYVMYGRPDVSAKANFIDPSDPMVYDATFTNRALDGLHIECDVGNEALGRDTLSFSMSGQHTTSIFGRLRGGWGAAGGVETVPITCQSSE